MVRLVKPHQNKFMFLICQLPLQLFVEEVLSRSFVYKMILYSILGQHIGVRIFRHLGVS
jgi:hypothetical protein